MTDKFDPKVFSAMQSKKPYASYRKTILGQIQVIVLNPFSNEPQEVIVKGRPEEDSSIVDTWNEVDDMFFHKMNENHFKSGNIIPHLRPQAIEKLPTIEQAGDEQLKEILSAPYFSLRSKLHEVVSPAVIYRLILLATDMEKPEKTMNLLKNRLFELETGVSSPKNEEE